MDLINLAAGEVKPDALLKNMRKVNRINFVKKRGKGRSEDGDEPSSLNRFSKEKTQGWRYSALAFLFIGLNLLPFFMYHATAQAPIGNSIPALSRTTNPESRLKNSGIRLAWITAYSSTPEETDDTPFITASGSRVRPGIVAANFLPIGTKIRIPKAFGNKIFTVEDRMNKRMQNSVDIWMSSKQEAVDFGITRTEIVVLD